ncbi:MAG: hypothetical protein QXF37_08325, partial [Archaeoglobaceae archaeon]
MQNKTDNNILITLIGLWIAILGIWAFIYFSRPNMNFDVEDVFIEGLLFILALFLLFLIRNFKPLILGWGIFTLALGIDLLDEFILDPEFFGTFVEGILKASGLILLFAGGIKFVGKLQERGATAEENLEWFRKLVDLTPVP